MAGGAKTGYDWRWRCFTQCATGCRMILLSASCSSTGTTSWHAGHSRLTTAMRPSVMAGAVMVGVFHRLRLPEVFGRGLKGPQVSGTPP